MAMTTFHKVTLIACMFLCISLLFPKMMLSREKKELGQLKVGPGHFPPVMQRQPMTEGQVHEWTGQSPARAHNPEVIARAAGMGTGRSGRSNLMWQIVPVYGFGILLYILYILFKITSKGKNAKAHDGSPAVECENLRRGMTETDLAKLQEKLKEREEARGHMCNRSRRSRRVRRVSLQREERLLRQLREVIHMMQESRQLGGVSPEMEAEQTHYAEDWEGYPEETFPQNDKPRRIKRYRTIILTEPGTALPTAEEQAEQMGPQTDMEEEEGLLAVSWGEEETGPGEGKKRLDGRDGEEQGDEKEDLGETDKEDEGCLDEVNKAEEEDMEVPDEVKAYGEESVQQLKVPALELKKAGEVEEPGIGEVQGRKEGKQISFSNTKEIFRYLVESSDDNDTQDGGWLREGDELEEEEEEDDPVVMAESLTFTWDTCSTPEQQEKHEDDDDEEEEMQFSSEEEGSVSESERDEDAGFVTLRKRNKREPE